MVYFRLQSSNTQISYFQIDPILTSVKSSVVLRRVRLPSTERGFPNLILICSECLGVVTVTSVTYRIEFPTGIEDYINYWSNTPKYPKFLSMSVYSVVWKRIQCLQGLFRGLSVVSRDRWTGNKETRSLVPNVLPFLTSVKSVGGRKYFGFLGRRKGQKNEIRPIFLRIKNPTNRFILGQHFWPNL